MLGLFQRAAERHAESASKEMRNNTVHDVKEEPQVRRFPIIKSELTSIEYRRGELIFSKDESENTMVTTLSAISADDGADGGREQGSPPRENVESILASLNIPNSPQQFRMESFTPHDITSPIRLTLSSVAENDSPCKSGESFDMIISKPFTSSPNTSRKEIGIKMKVELDVIDDVQEEVRVKVFLCLHYFDANATKYIESEETANKSPSNHFIVRDPNDLPRIFTPQIEFMNARSIQHVEGFKLLISKRTGAVYCYRVYRMCLRQVLAFERFPFDRQIVKVHLQSFTSR
jgi:hypothetical protein